MTFLLLLVDFVYIHQLWFFSVSCQSLAMRAYLLRLHKLFINLRSIGIYQMQLIQYLLKLYQMNGKQPTDFNENKNQQLMPKQDKLAVNQTKQLKIQTLQMASDAEISRIRDIQNKKNLNKQPDMSSYNENSNKKQSFQYNYNQSGYQQACNYQNPFYKSNQQYSPVYHQGFNQNNNPTYQYNYNYSSPAYNQINLNNQFQYQPSQYCTQPQNNYFTGRGQYIGGSSYNKRQGKCKEKRQEKFKEKRQKHRSRSSSMSSDASSADDHSRSKQKGNQPKNCRRHVNTAEQNKRNQLKQKLATLMVQRNINQKQQQKIIKILTKRLPQPLDFHFGLLMQSLHLVQQHGLNFHMPYSKIIKIVLKHSFDLNDAAPQIYKIQCKKIDKYQADQRFIQKYGQAAMPLNHQQLVQLDSDQCIFLIDGNNIIPTNKHLRKYMCQGQAGKVQAQIRSQWYFSNCILPQNIILFYDRKYEKQDYKLIQFSMIPSDHQQCFSKVKVVYGDGRIADDRIVQNIIQMAKQKQTRNVVLVSADRQLIQRCRKQHPIKNTSGKFFFKYMRYLICKKHKQNKQLRKAIKMILKY